MAEKKVGITGKVEIDQAKATSDLAELKAELTGFKTALDNVNTGVGLVLRSLSAMAKDMAAGASGSKATADAVKGQAMATAVAEAAMEDLREATAGTAKEAEKSEEAVVDLKKATAGIGKEAESLAEGFEAVAEDGVKEVVDGVKKADVETGKLNKSTEIMRGLWQRIGHKAIDGLVSAMRGLVGYMASFITAADDFGDYFDKMALRGVADIEKVRLAVVALAGEMGENLVDVVRSVDLAESLGAGEESVNAVRAALENYRVSGMDVNNQIEISTRLSRAFNLEMGQQAELLKEVGLAAQKARVSGDMLLDGMANMAPKVQQLGGTVQDLMRITTAAIGEGVKTGERGTRGFEELLNGLMAPTDEFGQKLAALGLIATETGPKWKSLNDEIGKQKAEFDALNVEIAEYKSQMSEIGLLTSQAERSVEKFEKLNQKRESGVKLNRLERTAYKELQKELAGLSGELAVYDKAGNIIANKEFARLGLLGQVKDRIDAAKEAQKDLNLANQEAEADAAKMGAAAQTLNDKMAGVAATLKAEIPAAIKAAISESGLPGFVSSLSAVPEALAALGPDAATLVTAVGGSLGAVSAGVDGAGVAVGGLSEQMRKLHEGGMDGLTRLKQNFGQLATSLMGPVANGMNAVSKMMVDVLNAPFGDNSSVFAAIDTWAVNVSNKVVADLDNVVKGNDSLSNVLRTWFELALEEVRYRWAEYVQPLIDGFMVEVESYVASMESKLTELFRTLGAQAAQGFKDGFLQNPLNGLFDAISRPVGQIMDDGLSLVGYGSGSAEIGDRGTGPVSAGNTSNMVINVNGAQDVNAVAAAVGRTISQQARLGSSGSRLR